MRRSGVRFPKAAPRSAAPSDHGRGIFANTFANSAICCCAVRRALGGARGVGLRGVHGLGEDVGRSGLGDADHMGVHAEGDRGVGVAQATRDHMHWNTGKQQGGGVDMPQVIVPTISGISLLSITESPQ